MSSLSSLSSMIFPSNNPKLLFHKPFLIQPRNIRQLQFSRTPVADQNLRTVSWSSSDYNGWEVVDVPPDVKDKSKGVPKIVIIGVGAAIASVLGVLGYVSLRKGSELQISTPSNVMHENLPHLETDKEDQEDHLSSDEVCVPNTGTISDVVDEYVTKGEFGRIIVPLQVDSTQQEALNVLKKLKIIDDEVNSEELCTRREYARWLVRLNSQLERSPGLRIMPPIALSGSSFPAFDDVSLQDPDFDSIQTLAEAGVIRSKLSDELASDGQVVDFHPERFISREDLICWKAKIEYDIMPGVDAEISRKNIGFLDARHISSYALVDLFRDISANEKSIAGRVFGKSKRFQSTRPSTKAQAAVALTSGRMMEFINVEVLRQEAEALSRQAAMEEIKFELLERGDIKRYWDRKIEDEREIFLQMEMAYNATMEELEREKLDIANILKQKAALECQQQLLSSLKEEVDEMSNKLEMERVTYIDEQSELQKAHNEHVGILEELLERKSVLEAELEALHTLRSWIEEEAQKSQSRAKVLQEASRRWRWDDQSNGTSSTT